MKNLSRLLRAKESHRPCQAQHSPLTLERLEDRTVMAAPLAATPSFLQAVYREALGRAPLVSDYTYWVNFGETNGAAAVPALVEHSPEASMHLVDGWFVQYLGHPPSGGQDQFFVNQLQAGATQEQVLSGLLASPEYYEHAPLISGVGGGSPTDTTFVTALFLQLLNRKPTASEITSLVGQVPTMGRSAMALDFLQSPEFRADVVTSYYSTLLQRSNPAAADVQYWVNSGLDLTGIRADFESSAEFLQLHQVAPVSITELPPVPTAASGLTTIVYGPDGNYWFTEQAGNKIGRMTPAGVVTEFPVPTTNSEPTGLTVGPDGNLWFTEQQAGKIGRITPAGQITEFALPSAGSGPTAITAGPDGNLWFAETTGNRIGRISTTGQIAEYALAIGLSGPNSITPGPDGNLWFTGATYGRITPMGASTSFNLGLYPTNIVTGPDGILYALGLVEGPLGPGYSAPVISVLDKITTLGATNAGAAVPEYLPFDSPEHPSAASLVLGPDGNLWTTFDAKSLIGSTSGPVNDLVGAMTTTGTAVTMLNVPTLQSGASSITSDPAGTLAFLETTANRVAIITNAADANQAFVQALYHDTLGTSVLGRAASVGDLSYWSSILGQSGTQAVASAIDNSPEARQRLVDSWFVQYLGHAPINGQDQYFINQLLAGASEEQVLSSLLGSAEYYQDAPQVPGVGGGAPSQTAAIKALYLQLLNRQASPADLSYWLGQIGTVGQAGVALGVLQSAEYRTVAVEGYFTTLLKRTPSSAEVAYWVNSGQDLTSIRVGLESSAEFYLKS
jgi:virginiamycin B lyase